MARTGSIVGTAIPLSQALANDPQALSYAQSQGWDLSKLTQDQYLEAVYHADPQSPIVQAALQHNFIQIQDGHVTHGSEGLSHAFATFMSVAVPIAMGVLGTAGAMGAFGAAADAADAGGSVADVSAAATSAEGSDAGIGAVDASGNLVGGDVGPGVAGIGGGDVGPGISPGEYAPVTTSADGSSMLSNGANGGSTLSKLLGAAGSSIGAANTAAGNNRLEQERLGLQANQENITGQSAFENALINRAALEDTQRKNALKDVYMNSYAQNPRVSPYDPAGAPKYSPQYMSTLGNVANFGQGMLSSAPSYSAGNFPALPPYKPINVKDVQGSTGTTPSTLSNIANWAGPTLSIASKIPWDSIFS